MIQNTRYIQEKIWFWPPLMSAEAVMCGLGMCIKMCVNMMPITMKTRA